MVIAPRWTPRIHEEWIGNLVAAGRAPRERLLLTLELMNSALPEANVRDWETYIEGLDLPDPDDCHVLAAALAAKAETIRTAFYAGCTTRTRSCYEPQQRWRTRTSAEARHRSRTT